MEVITVECPKCKGELFVKEGTQKHVCMYCRNEVVVRESKGNVLTTNHEFKAKLASAKYYEALYMKNQMAFIEVEDFYADIRLIGAHHAEYWLSRARFFATGVIRECNEGKVLLFQQARFIELYTLWMDTAVEQEPEIAAEVKAEKEKAIAEINAVFEEQKAREEAALEQQKAREEAAEMQRRRRAKFAEEERERQQQLELERREENAQKRKKIIIIVAVLVVLGFIGIMISRIMQARAEERRIIAEQEAEQQRLVAEQEAERQATWDLIEERIKSGYDTLEELIYWAKEQGISLEIHIDGGLAEPSLISAIDDNGAVGNYLGASPAFSYFDENSIVLAFKWEDLTHNEIIEELMNLDQNSEEAINDWLDSGGHERLESHFNQIFVSRVDSDYEPLEPVGARFDRKVFISWDVDFTRFNISDNSSITIYLKYQVFELGREDIQQRIIDLIDEKDRNEYIDVGAVGFAGAGLDLDWFSEWVGIDRELVNSDYVSIQILTRDANGNSLMRTSNELNENTFIKWEVEYFPLRNRPDRIAIDIFMFFNVEIEE